MFLPMLNPMPSASRRGVVLLVVIALLTLFAAVALSFVFYADAAATSSSVARSAEQPTRPDVDPEQALAYFLNKFIFGEYDDERGVYSAARGYDLSRSMFGWNAGTANNVPFIGAGMVHTTDPTNFMNPFGVDDYLLVNYTYYPNDPFQFRFIRDPERLNQRAKPRGWRTSPDTTTLAGRLGPYTGGFNVPYTFPDRNNLYLAAVDGSGAGVVHMPSFHRQYLFNLPYPQGTVPFKMYNLN